MERLINLGTHSHGHQNVSRMKLYRLQGRFLKGAFFNVLIPAFSPELAINKFARRANFEKSHVIVTLEHDSADRKFQGKENHKDGRIAYVPKNMGRNLVKLKDAPEILNVLANEFINGFNDRLSYNGKQTAKTRAKNANDPEFFTLGFTRAAARIAKNKPKKSRKARVKVAS